MTRQEAIILTQCLNTEALIVKNLDSEQYVDMLYLKRALKKYLADMAEEEKEVFKDFGYTEETFEKENKNFLDKLKAVQAKNFEYTKLNFLPMDVFKKFTNDVSFGISSVLADHILKQP